MAKESSRIRRLRKAKGLSIRDLAERAGVDNTHLGRIERGDQPPDGVRPRTMGKIAKALGTTVEELSTSANGAMIFRMLKKTDKEARGFIAQVLSLPREERDEIFRLFYEIRDKHMNNRE